PSETMTNIRWKGGAEVTLDSVADRLRTLCAENGINVVVDIDEVDSGKIFDRSVTPCVVIKNADHLTDYNYYLFTMQKQGIYSFISFYIGGTSKNAKRINQGNKEHATITGQIFGAIMKATVSNDAKDAEMMYYTILEDVLNELFA
ncbi:MAG: hypothetical protein IJA19_06920, partial [Clostridia bacterium]|nr:hypothetical protein [Clostridia bacterium]